MIDNKQKLNASDNHLIPTEVINNINQNDVGLNLSKIDFHKLTLPELTDTWHQFEGEYILLKWKLAMHISEKFSSKKEFGAYLKKLKLDSPNHALCMINQSTFYRYARASKFCEKFEINNPFEMGISPSAIYALSEKSNESVVNYNFINKLKNQDLTVSDIKRLIFEENSINGELVPESISKKHDIGLLTRGVEYLELMDNKNPSMSDVIEGHASVQPTALTNQTVANNIKLPNHLTEDEIVQAVINLLESLNVKPVKTTNDQKPYFKITLIEYGDPVLVTIQHRSDY